MILYYAKVSSGARARKGKNASLTCICAPIVAGYCPRTSTILDQGPIDTCNLEVQTSKLQSIHCGLPASWTRARRHPPSSPSPVASRGGGRALAFLNWTRVQLDRPLARREASNMGVYAQLSSGPISLPTAVRTAYPAQRAWSGSRAARFAWDPTTIIRKRRFKVSRQVPKGGSHPREPTIAVTTARHAQPVDTSATISVFDASFVEGQRHETSRDTSLCGPSRRPGPSHCICTDAACGRANHCGRDQRGRRGS